MTQTAVIFNGLPHAGLAQLVERWFCNPPSFALKIHQSLGFLRFSRPLVWGIPELTDRSTAPMSAQSKISDSGHSIHRGDSDA